MGMQYWLGMGFMLFAALLGDLIIKFLLTDVIKQLKKQIENNQLNMYYNAMSNSNKQKLLEYAEILFKGNNS